MIIVIMVVRFGNCFRIYYVYQALKELQYLPMYFAVKP